MDHDVGKVGRVHASWSSETSSCITCGVAFIRNFVFACLMSILCTAQRVGSKEEVDMVKGRSLTTLREFSVYQLSTS